MASQWSNSKNLWDYIGEFEKGEQKNDSKNPLLSKARQDARMKAYVELVEKELNKV